MHRAGLVALAIMLASPSAFAGEGGRASEPVKLIYRVPAGCPDEATFVDVVRSRTARAKFVEQDNDASRRFVVDIRRKEQQYEGRLVIQDPAARQDADRHATRELTSARCADLVRAFALFTAIAIDPGTDEPPPPSRSLAPPAPPIPAPAPPQRAALAPPAREPSKHEAVRARQWHLAWGSGAFVASGISQSMMVSAHPVIEIASRGPLLSPSVRLGLVWANSGGDRAGTAELTLVLRALVLSGCLVRLSIAEALGVRFCGVLEGGVLAVRPFGLERPRTPDVPWFALGPLLHLEVQVLAPYLSLAIDAGVAFPLGRLRAYVDPGPVVTEVDGIGARLGAAFLLQAF